MPVVTQQVKEAGFTFNAPHTTSSSGHHGFFLPISFQCLTFKARTLHFQGRRVRPRSSAGNAVRPR